MIKPSVSIFISAYNEESNIRNLIECILSQDTSAYTLTEILIVSDGSTDGTVKEASRIVDSRVKVVDSKERIGKSQHLNWFFENAKGDIPIFFDADVLLDSKQTIAELIQPIVKDPKVGLVGGNAQQTKGRTFIENAINLSCEVFDQIRITHQGGNNAFGANGCIMALSKEFSQKVQIPADTIANDQFLYFSCKKMGYTFIHQRTAIAWYRSPSTIKDHLRQNKRFVAAHYRMKRLFGNEFVSGEYAVDQTLMRRLKLRALFKKPIHAIALFMLNIYCKYYAKRDEEALDAKWYMAMSTKEKITYAE